MASMASIVHDASRTFGALLRDVFHELLRVLVLALQSFGDSSVAFVLIGCHELLTEWTEPLGTLRTWTADNVFLFELRHRSCEDNDIGTRGTHQRATWVGQNSKLVFDPFGAFRSHLRYNIVKEGRIGAKGTERPEGVGVETGLEVALHTHNADEMRTGKLG